MTREIVAALVDQVAATTGRTRASRITDAIEGRRRAKAELVAPPDVANDERSFRVVYYLLGVLLLLAVYTAMLSLGWQTAADWTIAGLLVVLGIAMAWWEHRYATDRAPLDGAVEPEPIVHPGFSDDPAELEMQLAELHAPARPLESFEKVLARPGVSPGVLAELPAGPPIYARVCARCGCDPLGETSAAAPAVLPPGTAADPSEAEEIARDALAERTADAADRGPT